MFPDPGKFAKTTATKAVFGVCVDPQHEEKVASFVENQVSVWDLRWFDKALHTLPPQKSSIVKVNMQTCKSVGGGADPDGLVTVVWCKAIEDMFLFGVRSGTGHYNNSV